MKLKRPIILFCLVVATVYVVQWCFLNYPRITFITIVGLVSAVMLYISRNQSKSFHDRLILYLKQHFDDINVRAGDNHARAMSYRNNFWLYVTVPGGDIEKLFVELCDFFRREGFEPVSPESVNCYADRACARFVHTDGEGRVLMIGRSTYPHDEFQVKITPALDERE